MFQNNAWRLRHGTGYWVTLSEMIKHLIHRTRSMMCHHHRSWHQQVKEIRQALYQTVPFSWILKGNWKVLHHLFTPGALETLCLFARLLFRHVAANLAYYPGTTLVSAMSHLCQLNDCHDLGRQEYYMATWKEANTWTQLSARLSHNTGLFSASIYTPLSHMVYRSD